MEDIRCRLNEILSPVQSPITESPSKALKLLITLCVSPGEPSPHLVNVATEWKGWWVYSWESIPQTLQMGSLCLNIFSRGKMEDFSPHHLKCFCTCFYQKKNAWELNWVLAPSYRKKREIINYFSWKIWILQGGCWSTTCALVQIRFKSYHIGEEF